MIQFTGDPHTFAIHARWKYARRFAEEENSMRIFATAVAVFALASAPCAWDSDPNDPPAIAAFFASLLRHAEAGPLSPQPGSAETGELDR
jgi:hypothetical protein